LLIAIVSLVPLNFFSGKLARLQFELETAASNVEVLANAGKLNGGVPAAAARGARPELAAVAPQ